MPDFVFYWYGLKFNADKAEILGFPAYIYFKMTSKFS